jgi:hypothetical protein
VLWEGYSQGSSAPCRIFFPVWIILFLSSEDLTQVHPERNGVDKKVIIHQRTGEMEGIGDQKFTLEVSLGFQSQ